MNEPIAKPIDFAAERCGHNYEPEQCPHDDCGYREALARISELEAENRDLRNKLAHAIRAVDDLQGRQR